MPELREARRARIPNRRFARPEDIAVAAVFLATAETEMMIGTTLAVDEGTTVG